MYQRTEEEIMKNWSKQEKSIVTVCCITYNQERYIDGAIKSFLMQETDFPFEIIIHDDASTDNTANIVKSYAEKYPQIIKAIFQKENQYSQGKKILITLSEIAQGDYIAICEGDDYWIDPQKLQIQVSKMKEYPECHISFHGVNETMNNAVESLNLKHKSKQYEKEQIFDVETVIAGGGYFMQTPSLMFYKDVFKDIPDFFYTAPAGDYVLQFLGSLNGGALYINRIMGVYRISANGSWRKSIENVDNYFKFQMAWFDSYLTINRYYDRKYEKEIMVVLKSQELYLPRTLLEVNRPEEFKKVVNVIYSIQFPHSFEFLIMYYFRSAPKLLDLSLKSMYEFKKIMSRFKRILKKQVLKSLFTCTLHWK